jgi:alpha-amylase
VSDVEVDQSTGQCLGDWVCEHRWPAITRLVGLRNVALGSPLVHWWDNGQHQVAFARARRAFVAINHEESTGLNVVLQTGLTSGVYCDVISGKRDEAGRCTGRNVSVEQDGTARINIVAGRAAGSPDPIIAIHVGQSSCVVSLVYLTASNVYS